MLPCGESWELQLEFPGYTLSLQGCWGRKFSSPQHIYSKGQRKMNACMFLYLLSYLPSWIVYFYTVHDPAGRTVSPSQCWVFLCYLIRSSSTDRSTAKLMCRNWESFGWFQPLSAWQLKLTIAVFMNMLNFKSCCKFLGACAVVWKFINF